MSMPDRLVLVRHGESEGNLAKDMQKAGEDVSFLPPEFSARGNARLRLTNRGRWQAKQAGIWIRENIRPTFDRYIVSEFTRAVETAAHLELPDAKWYLDYNIRERSWGDFDFLPYQDREKFKDSFDYKRRESFYWTPNNGESIAQLCLRVDRTLDTLHRECDGKNVIIVCHGETIRAFQVRLERLSPRQFHANDAERGVDNCCIVEYLREAGHLRLVRTIVPWQDPPLVGQFEPITRKSYSNEELLEEAALYPQLLDRPDNEV